MFRIELQVGGLSVLPAACRSGLVTGSPAPTSARQKAPGRCVPTRRAYSKSKSASRFHVDTFSFRTGGSAGKPGAGHWRRSRWFNTLIVALLVGGGVVGVATAADSVPGDANGDGQVTEADAQLILERAASGVLLGRRKGKRPT